MRIASYNILDGGVGRADPLAEVLEAQGADLVVLVEADDRWVLDRIASRLGMDVIHAPGRKHAVAVLSRWPIVQTVNHAPRWVDGPRCLVEAVIRLPGSIELPVLALHLHARTDDADEDRRMTEIGHLMDVTAEWRAAGRPHVIAGDFNANAPSQQIDIDRCKKSTQASYARNGNRLPRRVIQQLLDHGYVDTLQAANPEMAERAATFTTHEPGQRVDYIFTHGIPTAQIRSAWVETDRLATFASDHYPIGAEIHV
ncbi:MAG: endonuclease/exonuclease/phosphatase family protein [Tepidisphaeraceae bacterium]